MTLSLIASLIAHSRNNSDSDFSAYTSLNHLQIAPFTSLAPIDELPYLQAISSSSWQQSCLSRQSMKWYSPPAIAPPISMYCNDRTFIEWQNLICDAPLETLALYGLPYRLRESEDTCAAFQTLLPGVSPMGLAGMSPSNQLPTSNMLVPEAKRLIYDSAKLSRLDALLQELKSGDHRVLVYFQMTRMMDLMEEYLIYRQYKYLRLDGSSKLEDRRDMVIDWQTRSVKTWIT
jgi:DNA helicase INO80